MNKRAAILFLLYFSFHCEVTCGQLPDYHVQAFNEKNGLQTFYTTDLVKDYNGFIWLLHRLKIQRFDGKQVKDFTFDEQMFAISCDDENTIWAASRSSVYRYDEKQKGFRKILHDTTGNPTLGRFLKLPGYGLVLQSNKCFYYFDLDSESFKKINSGALSTIRSMTILAADIEGNKVFVHGRDTLYRIDIKTNEIARLPGANDVNSFQALTEDTAIVSSFNNYSYWFDFKNKTIRKIDIGKGLGETSSFFLRTYDGDRLNENEYLITSIRGLLLYNLVTRKFKRVQLYSEGKPVRYLDLFAYILVDDQKNVWITHTNNGLIYFKTTEGQVGLLRNPEIEERLSWHNNIRNFSEDDNGDLWFATLNGFAHFNLRTGKITPYKPNVNDTTTYSFPSIRGIACNSEYVILGPTNRGVWLYNINKKKYKRPNFLPNQEGIQTRQKLENDFIDNICELKSGDYIISARDGHYYMSDKDFLVTAIHYPGERENGNFAYQEQNGNIWLANQKKLYCFDPGMKYLFRLDMDTAYNISALIEIEPGTYLLSGKGVFLLRKKPDNSFDVSLLDPYFKNLIVSTLFLDKSKKIWMGTSDGLIRYDLVSRRPELFNQFDNVEGNIFNSRCCHLTKSGVLFLGGFNGINYLIPEKVLSGKDSLEVSVIRFAVNNEELGTHNFSNKFRHSQNTIDVEFSAPYFSSVNRVRYRYQLEGLDKQWVNNGTNNTVRFTTLAPGDYHFRVEASINNEDWFGSKQIFSFVIRPPYWSTWWFRSAVVILIAGSVFALYRYQLRKRLEVERLRLRISRDLHDDIGSTLSSINILARSSLTKRANEEGSNVLLEKIQQRSQKTLDAMDDLIWNTKPENDSLESLIIRMREYAAEVLEAANISFTLNSPVSISHVKLDMQQKRNLYLIFKEAINNLAKYSNAKKAIIQFEYQKKFLQMIIRDEGTGFTLTSIRKGNGLDNMQHRAAEMNAQFEIHSGNGNGTTIRVHLPV